MPITRSHSFRLVSRALLALALAFCLGYAPSARAESTVLSTDQLLSTLASVISDRAKSVAARAIQRRLSSQLCGKTLTLDPGGGLPKEQLVLGGSDECKKSEPACDVNDQFVASCRLIGGIDAVPLQDAAFLQALSEDTITFAIRVAATRADKTTLEAFKIDKIAQFLVKITRQAKRSDASAQDVVEGLLELERDVGDSQQVARTILDQIRQSKGATQLLQQLLTPEAKAVPTTYSPLLQIATFEGGVVTIDKDKYEILHAKLKAELGDKNSKLAASGTSCTSDSPLECPDFQRGRVVDALAKLWGKADDYPRDLRNLSHILREFGRSSGALTSTGAAQYDQFVTDIRNAVNTRVIPGPPPYLQLAVSSSFEFGAYLTLAELSDEAANKAWLDKLRLDMNTFLMTCARPTDSCDYGALLNGEALKTPPETGPGRLLPVIDHARGALKTLLALPWLVTPAPISQQQDYLRGILISVRRLFDQLDALAAGHTDGKWSYQDTVRIVPSLLRVSSAAFGMEFRAALEPAKTATGGYLQFAAALTAAADAFDEALDRQWVALATTAYRYSEQAGAPASLQHALAFTRLLLSVREAQSQEEAKGQFEAALEDESSREKRWSSFSVDVGALVGARGTYGTTRTVSASGAKDWQGERSGGVYAPVGLMLGYKAFGLLVYPIDVGAYLTGSNQEGDPTWPQALRGGAAVSLRPWPEVPIAFSASFDGRPQWREDTPANLRAGVSASLELPLFLLY